ncbi:MAG: bifunctional phosphoribosyl-AMP cyclohydrolase/phosphoribosyl-ATP diphosphatase HisIE [Thermoanaerobaculum sp.]
MGVEESLRYDPLGLVPAVVQHALTGEVLMLGFMNAEAVAKTQETGLVHFFSRSRNTLWQKGETSGNRLALRGMVADCDGDALLVLAVPQGPTCHTGAGSCFHQTMYGQGWVPVPAFLGLLRMIRARQEKAPEGSYTARLLASPDEALKKLVEEAGEVVLAARGQGQQRLVEELADLLYHLAVVLVAEGVSVEAINRELEARGLGGHP